MKYFKPISAILIGGLILTACSSKNTPDSGADGSQTSETASVPVRVKALTKTKIARTIDYSSTILPFEEVNMAPASPGRIEKIYVETGDRIRKGDDLFLMDRTQLYQQKVQLASLEKDLSRLDTLLMTGSVREQQYDQMKTQYDVTKTNVEFMEENTLLKAPFDGVVTGKYFENGEIYSGTPTTATGRSAVVTVMQINPVKVNVGITEQYYPLVKKGMKVMITADVYPGDTFTGTVSLKAPTINPATRTFLAEAEIPNRNEALKPGMYVRVSLELGEAETFVAPANTVMVQEGTNIRYVFVASEGTARRVEVSIGKRFDDSLEIISEEIKEGELLIVEGQSRLINGDRIEIVR
ncbi:MAG: efflux RND transporter periplasmic adaptor subunit [Bacteroidales bacterium]|nr:efflux RND transporter periplasmic adaptor subunit [Bacteroidales bacterium]MBN2634121.1 efflux RND transporter periplasmic adaptor subunit [Bacteroidales bacterium]